MTPASARGPIVVDTGVFGARLASRSRSRLSEQYDPIVAGRPAIIAAQTVMELRFGALRGRWGSPRLLRLEAMIGQAQIVNTGGELVDIAARLRATCVAVGHALGQSEHNGDLWIAATAIRLGVPLVSDDGIFRDAPGLTLETAVSGVRRRTRNEGVSGSNPLVGWALRFRQELETLIGRAPAPQAIGSGTI